MTIKDVARASGVSVATVSRVLNENQNVRKNTRDRVLRVIEDLGYRPNLLGRNLRRSRTGNILVLQPSAVNDFYSQIIRGIEDIAGREGYYVLVCHTNSSSKTEMHYLSLLKDRLADGVICLAPESNSAELRELSREYPLVYCSEYHRGNEISTVTINNRAAAREAVEHLISLGHRKIALAAGNPKFISSTDRKQGYFDALTEAKIEICPEYIKETSYSVSGGERACNYFFKLKNPPTAVFAPSDNAAVGIVRALKSFGLAAGCDVGVIGFDDTKIASVYNPSITTVAQPRRKLGRAAMELLLEKIVQLSSPPKQLIFPHELIIRESTAGQLIGDN